jgi:hypothetical protein
MNTEDLIRAANPVRTTDLADGDSPAARRTFDQVLAQAARAEGRTRGFRRMGRRTLATAAVAATTAGVAFAVLVSLAPGPAPRSAASATRPSGVPSRPIQRVAAPSAHTVSARQVLLTAAEHVSGGPASGNYWRVRLVGGYTFPAGTTAHPYDITVTTSADQWNPRTPGVKEWAIFQNLGARPATPADEAPWRAAGSPQSWHSGKAARLKSGWPGGYPVQWMDTLAATTSPSPTTASSTVSDGTVGYVEGDLAGLDAAQFSAMPTSEPGILKVLDGYYAQLRYCNQNPGQCSTKDQIIWAEAVMLLQDPVSPQVRAATFKVMAGLPGVRTLGLMTDPLGRTGYALAPAGQDPNADPQDFNPLRVILVDPQTGSLLATEELGPMPRSLHCLSFDSKNHCAGSSYVGRSYPYQVDDFVAVVSESWTNAAPVLPPPARWTPNLGSPGLPPLP